MHAGMNEGVSFVQTILVAAQALIVPASNAR
jgi:hypothetical protein